MRTFLQWHKIGLRHHHGVALPLSALTTSRSCGVGEFNDLLPLIHWCKSLGFDVIQLLPLTDMGDDYSPYNSCSASALDPLYLSLADLPEAPPKTLLPFSRFNQTERVQLAEIKKQKLDWLRNYFQKHFQKVSNSADYEQFLHTHPWLRPYAAFKALKKEFGGISWRHWPKQAQSYREEFDTSQLEEFHFHQFVQYLCYRQLEAVHDCAARTGLFLKGDVPILLSPDSADVWAHPELFDLSLGAGVPPDFYNKEGQDWGFPLYQWRAHQNTQFAWWKERLRSIESLFDLYRIDHVVGFFRIWAIPEGKPAREGHFIPENRNAWTLQGKNLLEMMIDASSLLPIAEDLGTIPSEVRPLLHQLGICRTHVIRWETTLSPRILYTPYSQYEPFSLTTVSTHDCDILKGWWNHYPDEARAFAEFKHWSFAPEISIDQIAEILFDSHHTPSYFHINLLQEYLSLFPDLSHPNPEKERINVPGTVDPSNWSYRFRPSLETIISHEPLAARIREIIRPLA